MDALRNQFQLKHLRFSADYGRSFALSRWQSGEQISGWFILYRVLLALLFICILLSSILTEDWNLWWIFLTDWSFIGLTIHFIISAAVVIEQLLNEYHGTRNDGTLLTKMSWVSYNLATPMSIGISIMFWTALYDYSSNLHAEEFLFHAVNSIAVVLDLFIGARPFFLLHFYQPAVVMFGYGLFTLIYWAAGGLGIEGEDYIYWVINWDKPGYTVLILIVLYILSFLEQVFLWGLHGLRDFLYRKFVTRSGKGNTFSGEENTTFEE